MLKVNEIFGPTIQGEGKTAGKEVIFLRLANCNLFCSWCDTPYTWNWIGTQFKHPRKSNPKDEIKNMESQEVLEELHKKSNNGKVKALVITGGEPLLQQKQLIGLLIHLKNNDWWIEVETNGTIIPSQEFVEFIDQINCSPKLSNSGNNERMRENEKALVRLASIPKTVFKFVISSKEDIMEIKKMVKKYDMREVYLMPQGTNLTEMKQSIDITHQLCQQTNFKFSPRLHITKFDGKRGV